VICVWHPFYGMAAEAGDGRGHSKAWPEMRVLHLPNYDRLAEELPDTIFCGYFAASGT